MDSYHLKLDGRELDHSTPIWRYMGLGTLFYLLGRRRLFIPKMSTLQKEDPFEGQMTLFRGHQEFQLVEHELRQPETLNWLAKSTQKGGTLYPWETIESADPVKLWLRELSRRRIVWCWHESESECMAQWRIYGKESGIAIQSDVGSVLRALKRASMARDLVYGRVCYLAPNKPLFEAGDKEGNYDARGLAWYPHFIKNTVFKHEKEVRFLAGDSPDGMPGYPIDVNPSELVKSIILSPFMRSCEAAAIMEIIRNLLRTTSGLEHSVDLRQSGAQDLDSTSGQGHLAIDDLFAESRADDWIRDEKSSDSIGDEEKLPKTMRLLPTSEISDPSTTKIRS